MRSLNENLTTDLTDNTDFLSEIPPVCVVCVVCGLFSFPKVNAHGDRHHARLLNEKTVRRLHRLAQIFWFKFS
jgi:hypothetical protein